MKRRRFLEAVTTCLFALLITAVPATPAMAQGNSGTNKDKDDSSEGDDGTPVPVEYQLHFLPVLGERMLIRDMNEFDDVVGTFHPGAGDQVGERFGGTAGRL